MNAQGFNKSTAVIYGLPLLVILISIALTFSPLVASNSYLATGIIYDLTLTAPLLFLCLSRKSKISKLKVVPFFIIGTLIASYFIPKNNQGHLHLIITYLVPVLELSLFTFILIKLRKAFKVFRKNSNASIDFLTLSRKSISEFFGESRFSNFLSSEITMFYYAFFSWKPRKRTQLEFTNYKENASMALGLSFLMLIGIETYAFHVLLAKWNTTVAWIFTAVSIYSAFMVIGHIKALLQRPSVLTKEKLTLKNGLLADVTINLNEIDFVEVFTKELIATKDIKIGNLGIQKESTDHNIAIHFRTPQTIVKVYGLTNTCDVLLIHMDNRVNFVTALNSKLDNLMSPN